METGKVIVLARLAANVRPQLRRRKVDMPRWPGPSSRRLGHFQSGGNFLFAALRGAQLALV